MELVPVPVPDGNSDSKDVGGQQGVQDPSQEVPSSPRLSRWRGRATEGRTGHGPQPLPENCLGELS